MVVNFRTRGISRGERKLTRTSTLIKTKKTNLYLLKTKFVEETCFRKTHVFVNKVLFKTVLKKSRG
jgi:hypothetical protein